MRSRARLCAAGLAWALLAGSPPGQSQTTAGTDDPSRSTTAPQANEATSLGDLMHDPDDGGIDMSRWLLEHKGFLPVPIIISDPAVGYGGGLALVFFHRPQGQATQRTTADGG